MGMCNNDDGNRVTTVKVKKDTWQELNRMKQPGDSFDDVLQRVLQNTDDDGKESNEGNRTRMTPTTAD